MVSLLMQIKNRNFRHILRKEVEIFIIVGQVQGNIRCACELSATASYVMIKFVAKN